MKAKWLLLVCVAALLGSLTLLHAADITGKWTAERPGRDGQTMTTTFNFKQSGAAVTGTTSGFGPNAADVELKEGKVEGDKVMFTTTANFNGNEFTQKWTGAIAGDEISFTREMQGGGGFGGGKGGGKGGAAPIVAKRAK